jgi:hypothetical protein
MLKRRSKKSNNFHAVESLDHSKKKNIIAVNSDPLREVELRLTKTTDFTNLPFGSNEKNFSILLDRTKIAKSSNHYDTYKKQINSSVVDRNRNLVHPN